MAESGTKSRVGLPRVLEEGKVTAEAPYLNENVIYVNIACTLLLYLLQWTTNDRKDGTKGKLLIPFKREKEGERLCK